jgi:hypothetical protein
MVAQKVYSYLQAGREGWEMDRKTAVRERERGGKAGCTERKSRLILNKQHIVPGTAWLTSTKHDRQG